MMKPAILITLTLLALCLFPAPAMAASEDEVWWGSAVEEAGREGYKLIDTKELAELLDSDADAVIVDVRADYEFAAGHIPDAENLEFDLGDRMDLSGDKRAAFEKVLGEDKGRRVILYCRSFR